MAGVQVTALDNDAHLAAHTEDLSLFGCFVETMTPFATGTKVAVRIAHEGAVLIAQGRIAFCRESAGMGIAFTFIDPSSVSLLDTWLTETELRK